MVIYNGTHILVALIMRIISVCRFLYAAWYFCRDGSQKI